MKTASTTFLPVLATMLLSVCITPSARADRAENAFVKVRAVGADVTRVDGRNFSANEDGEVEIEAQPGWTLLTPGRVRVTKGRSPHYQVRSSGGEQTGGGDIWRTVTERVRVHVQDPALTAALDAGGPYVYAAPSNGVWVAVSGSATGTPGLHVWEVRTTVYKNGEVVDTSAEIEPGDPFPLELDRWKWTWSPGAPGETNVQSFVSEPVLLPKGTYTASGTAEAWSSQCPDCHASKPASEPFVVSLLTISCNPWIGQDRTGDPSTPYTSPKVTATAALDPENPDVKKVAWSGENKCEKRESHDWSITLWTEDRDKASDTYLGEKVTATACGATATTNFTIVKVDVDLDGLSEVSEESIGAFVPMFLQMSDRSAGNFTRASIKCFPELPNMSEFVVSDSVPSDLQDGYPRDIPKNRLFGSTSSFQLDKYIVGTIGSTSLRDRHLVGCHQPSGASDMAAHTDFWIDVTTDCGAAATGNNKRTKVGVAEKMTIEVHPAMSVVWTKGNGDDAEKLGEGQLVHNEAPHRAASVSITATVSSGSSVSLSLQVVEPVFAAAKINDMDAPSGIAFAGMFVILWAEPADVSFERLEWREVGGTTDDFDGYFSNPEQWKEENREHKPAGWTAMTICDACKNAATAIAKEEGNPTPQPDGLAFLAAFYRQKASNPALEANVNYLGTDMCRTGYMSQPWSDGYIQWEVPFEWRVISTGSSVSWGDDKPMRYEITETGDAYVKKFGYSSGRAASGVFK